jgi:hypothetical protein
MAAIAKNISFQERLMRIEAEQRARAVPAPAESELPRFIGTLVLRIIAVMPVWLVLLKAVLIWQMGLAGYGARLATIDAHGFAGQVVRLAMQPDAFTLALARLIASASGF